MDVKDTLNLPKTSFPMKANLPQKEPQILKKWYEEKLYEKIIQKNNAWPKFIFHDGPPYANANIHLGTAMNKILKDFVVRFKNMTGFRCEFVPGWDCHGLPIELQATAKLKPEEKKDPLEVRKLCRAHAEKYINVQREQFKRLGVLANWDHPYLTMSFDYEAIIVRELATLASKKLLQKGKKVIHWCAQCRTALAEAEIEYEEKESPSIYVKFPLTPEAHQKFSQKIPALKNESVSILIWTTTPWTLPANLAIALHPEFTYVAVKVNNEVFILAEGLLESVQKECGISGPILAQFKASELVSLYCQHPFLNQKSLILLGDHVTLESGTGCVHTAPGHGEEDYYLGLKHGLEIFSPVDHRGYFTQEMPEYAGQFVFDTNAPIIQRLAQSHHLIKESKITHSYPHCWRCKKPVLFRATEQWFLLMDKSNLRKEALEWISKVRWIPSWGKNRIQSMIETRPDWCLSRQRVWGVPIPALYCKHCSQLVTDAKFMASIADRIEKEGADFWFKDSAQELSPQGLSCSSCHSKEFEKEKDILDVWFDSGCSFSAVLEHRENLHTPADLYLEGSDQHRGWFHTSLLVSIATRNCAPYKAVLTHGFVVDETGRKMSKSLGNVVEPEKVISQYGAEILRLWAASEDYRNDVRCSDHLLTRVGEIYRKIRNTCRHMLANISDFDPQKDSIPYQDLLEIDQWILLKLQHLTEKIRKAYEDYEFHSVLHTLNNFCVVELSSLYLDILKDRLYTFASKSVERRAAQTALTEILNTVTQLMSPILSFTAEEIYEHIPGKKEDSVHLTALPQTNEKYLNPSLEERWAKLLELRENVSKVLEEMRKSKDIGNSLEAHVILHVSQEWKTLLEETSFDLSHLFIVSQVTLQDASSLKIEAVKASGKKCERCWIWSESVTDSSHMCTKCQKQLKS